MLNLQLDVDGVVAALQVAGENLGKNIPMALALGADLVAVQAKTVHGYTDRSGSLTNSIMPDEVSGSFATEDLSVVVGAGAPHGLFVEAGTRAHKIKPKHRKSLRWPVAGGFAFARVVDHPGTQAYRFLSGALETALPELEAAMQDATALSFAQAGFEVAH